MKKYQLGVIMDPIENIDFATDTSLALLLEAQKREYDLYYMQLQDIYIKNNNRPFAEAKKIAVKNHSEHYYEFLADTDLDLSELDFIFIRNDPPLTMQYIYITQMLDLLDEKKVRVINHPQALRNFNEKLFITRFPELTPPTIVTASQKVLKDFLLAHQDIILKPLYGKGGTGVFRVTAEDRNFNVIVELLTQNNSMQIMAQKYIPEVKETGDKRILMLHGEAFPDTITRLPKAGETRANIAVGGSHQKTGLTERDKFICAQIAPVLNQHKILLAGLDIIGGYLSEINITSPTCLRMLEYTYGCSLAPLFFDRLERQR